MPLPTIDYHEMANHVGLGVLFVLSNWWRHRQHMQAERDKAEDAREEEDAISRPGAVGPPVRLLRTIAANSGRLDEMEVALDRHERWFEEHDKRISAAERFIVAARRNG